MSFSRNLLIPGLRNLAMATWIWKHFDELNPTELYQILKLRSEVFVVEQACVYQDMDELDLQSWHLMGLHEKHEHLIAYCRITPPGSRFREISVGRVVVKQSERGKGLGREIVSRAGDEILIRFGSQDIKISAQCYLEKYYASLGYERCSEDYLEDNIPHVAMKKRCIKAA